MSDLVPQNPQVPKSSKPSQTNVVIVDESGKQEIYIPVPYVQRRPWNAWERHPNNPELGKALPGFLLNTFGIHIDKDQSLAGIKWMLIYLVGGWIAIWLLLTTVGWGKSRLTLPTVEQANPSNFVPSFNYKK